jgi:glycerophosphoryl diester phosphodiesterase
MAVPKAVNARAAAGRPGWSRELTFRMGRFRFLVIRNIAHRGASAYAPENTLAAFRLAVKFGARCIETDLRLTKDGEIVTMHDAYLQRTTGKRRFVAALTLEEIRQLDAGSRFRRQRRRKFQGERVPSLQDVLRLARSAGVTLYLELKTPPGRGLEAAVVRELREADAVSRVIVISFHDGALREVKALEPALATGWLEAKTGRGSVRRALGLGASEILRRGSSLTPELIAVPQDAGLQVIAWTVNDARRMRELVRMGVDGIITDYPDRLEQVIEELETVLPGASLAGRKQLQE